MKINAVIAALFLSLAAVSQPSPVIVDQVAAVIGSEIILQSDVDNQLQQLRQQYNIAFAEPCDILEDLLLQKLMLHQAKIDSVEVSEQQIQNELDRRIRYFVEQFGSEKKMEEFYQKSLVQVKAEFHDLVSDQLQIQAMQAKIVEDVNITPAEVREFFDEIPADSLPLLNSQVEVAQIVIYPPENRDETRKVMERLEKIRADIKAGKDFATMAVLYSEDPGSASQGGELGMQDKGALVPEFDAVAFSLQDGEVSKVFKTRYGYHVMQMIERRGEKYNARHILMKPKVKPEDLQRAKATLDSIHNLIKVDSLTFEVAAVKFSQDEDTKNNGGIIVNGQTGSPRFDMSEVDPQITFTIDKLEVGEMSAPVIMTSYKGDQGYRILKLIERTQPHRANLSEDYQLIQDAASAELREKAISDWANARISSTYVRLDERYQGCKTKYNWTKKSQ